MTGGEFDELPVRADIGDDVYKVFSFCPQQPFRVVINRRNMKFPSVSLGFRPCAIEESHTRRTGNLLSRSQLAARPVAGAQNGKAEFLQGVFGFHAARLPSMAIW